MELAAPTSRNVESSRLKTGAVAELVSEEFFRKHAQFQLTVPLFNFQENQSLNKHLS